MWEQQSYSVTRIQEDAQWIHCLVNGIETDVECYLSVIYGFNTAKQRKSLWVYLEKKTQSIVNPWIICVDFNALHYPQDRLSRIDYLANQCNMLTLRTSQIVCTLLFIMSYHGKDIIILGIINNKVMEGYVANWIGLCEKVNG